MEHVNKDFTQLTFSLWVVGSYHGGWSYLEGFQDITSTIQLVLTVVSLRRLHVYFL
jgi:hypothetical protein